MMIPGIMAQRRAIAAATPWTPLNMDAVPQIYLDAEDSAVTDVAGTCSLISNLGSLGSAGDFVQNTSGKRPLIVAAGMNGKRILQFDGSDDQMTCSTNAARDIHRNAAAAWAFAVYKKGEATGFRLLITTASGNTGALRFTTYAGNSTTSLAPELRARRLDGESFSSLISASTGPTSRGQLLYSAVDYSIGAGEIRRDAEVLSSNPSLVSTGSTSDTMASAPVSLGAASTGSVYLDMDFAAILLGNSLPSAGDIDKIHGWAAHKWGLADYLPVDHPYKAAPPTV